MTTSRPAFTSQFDARKASNSIAATMNTHDRRMDIRALCSAEEPGSLADPASEPFISPLSAGRGGECTTKKASGAAQILSSSQVPTKKRSRCLSNSERGKLYRSRRKNYVQTLEQEVEQLKSDVYQLHLRSRLQCEHVSTWSLIRQPVGPSFANVVNKYFSLFKFGLPVAKQCGVMDIAQDQVLLSNEQAGFLNGLMHPNIVFGNSYGLQELLSQWGKYSLYHAGLMFEVKSLQIMVVEPNPVVLAPATLYVRFTRRTIEKIFPHILWNEMLVQRLIGKEFAYPVTNAFYFGSDNKIHRFDTIVDFAAAFMSVLGNIEECVSMMESALIRQKAMISDLLEEPDSVKVNYEEVAPRVEMMDISSVSSSENGQCKNFAPEDTCVGMSLPRILEQSSSN
ncbi:hypothetical protein PsorP6_003338 [Peronosclerospora sorghi]|uniref:Uncharacterized protein n=1 Tax=Peronosclerospora sorghi TaxID=230839 RepID=A0ACC0VN56_9STRA|nr:hypothetical protein PsorP6_003338 [Peronosclerospora sorghi]